jgi:hypothetical protein
VQRSGLAHSFPHIVHGLPMPSSFASAGGHPGGGSMPTSITPASRVPQAGGLAFDEQPAAAHSHNAVRAIAVRVTIRLDYRRSRGHRKKSALSTRDG